MNIEIHWPDGEGARFTGTSKPVDRISVWPNLKWAKMEAAARAKAQRDLWASHLKKIQEITEADVDYATDAGQEDGR